jgi:hypothetical protein
MKKETRLYYHPEESAQNSQINGPFETSVFKLFGHSSKSKNLIFPSPQR